MTTPLLRRLSALLLPVLAVALLAACGGDEDDDGLYVSMLGLVPDTEEARESGVSIGNVARSRELIDLDVPETPEEPGTPLDGGRVLDYLSAFAGTEPGMQLAMPFFPSEHQDLRRTAETAPETYAALGLSVFDVDQWLVTGFPPRQLHAMRGQFDADAIQEHVNACDECPPVEIETQDGARLFLWGEDGQMDLEHAERGHPPLFDRFGRRGNLGVTEDALFYSTFGDDLRRIADTANGGDSLADDAEFRTAAEAMDNLQPLSAVISARTLGPQVVEDMPSQIAEAWRLDEGESPLRAYRVVAVGPGWDDGEPYLAVALVHGSETDARENAERLPDRVMASRFPRVAYAEGAERWGDVIDDIAIEVDGQLVTARLQGFAIQTTGLGGSEAAFLLLPFLQHE